MLRDKDLPEEQILPLARQLRAMTAKSGTLLILNRRPRIARAVGADGVHLGVDGPTIAQARNELGADAIVGYSAHAVNEALAAFEQGADYTTFSPIYETPGKSDILQPVGLEALERLAGHAPGPVIALGGINAANIEDVAKTGAAGVAVIRAIFGAAAPGKATARLLELWRSATRKNSPAPQPR